MEKILIPECIFASLKNDPVQNCNILNFVEDNPVTDFFTAGNSLLVKGISDRVWIYISSRTENEFLELITKLHEGDLNFAVIEDWQIPILEKRFNIRIELTTMKYYLPAEVKIKLSRNQKLVPLTIDDSEYIYSNTLYKEFTDIDYINARITKGISCGLLNDNKLIAWAITHDDGAIGFLHVMDEYRGKGFAKDIMNHMIHRVREIGRVPFVQIEENNFRSISLVKKLGFTEYKRVHWLNAKLSYLINENLNATIA